MRFATPLTFRMVLLLLWSGFFVLGCLHSPSGHRLAISVLIIAGGYQAVRGLIYIFGAVLFETKTRKILIDPSRELPKVSVLVPAYNEEEVIESTLQSLGKLNYPHLEILVLDDGSTDQTFAKASTFYPANHTVRVITQKNSGKAEALNRGILEAKGELILCVDADSMIEPNDLIPTVRRLMADPQCAAVGGVVDVDDSTPFWRNFLSKQQKLEYFMGHLQKSTLALFGKINVVPGPAGLFRKEKVIEVGGYRPATVTYAEDMDLTLRLIAAGYSVKFDPGLTTKTQVPNDWDELMKQRYRWVRGTYQAVVKSFPALVNSKDKTNKPFAAYLLIEQMFSLALEVGILFYFVPRLLFYGDIQLFSKYFLVLLGLDAVQAAVSFSLKKRPIFEGVVHVLGQRFYYSIVLLTWKVFALREEWGTIAMTWDKVYRYKYTASAVVEEKIHV